MSFRTNLQYLRSQRNMTQEQLAMLLGVSRQAISKWESEKAYPEMDKLLMICDLFGCTLDDLVLGDVSVSRPAAREAAAADGETAATGPAAGKGPGAIAPAAALPQDLTGYDRHRRRFAPLPPTRSAAIVAATGIGCLFDSGNSILGATPLNGFLTLLCICVGVIVGLAALIPGGMSHADFKRRHPYVKDFYAEDDRSREMRVLVTGIVAGIAMILIGTVVLVYADDVLGVSDGWPVTIMLVLCAAAVFCFVYCGMRYGMLDIDGYNKEAESDRKERAGEQDFYARLTGTVCGIIMMVATVIALCLLFLSPAALRGDWSSIGSGVSEDSMFWLPWPIGGILCGIAAAIIRLVKDYRER